MTHLTEKEIQRYVLDDLLEEERTQYEAHLYDCDECLTMYMTVLEVEESSLPKMRDDIHFTDEVMVKIKKSKSKTENEGKGQPFHQRTLFHYVVAAAMTIIFMSSGVFEGFTGYVNDLQTKTFSENKPSVTEQLIDTIYEREEE